MIFSSGASVHEPYYVSEASTDTLHAQAVASAGTLVPLNALQPRFLADLAPHIAVQALSAGDLLFAEGTVDHQHIYLLFGEVELFNGVGLPERVRAGATGAPLAHQQPRPCSAVAISDTTVLRIDSDLLDRSLSWSQISQYLMSELALQRDLDEDIEWMQTVVNSNLFLKVPPVNVERIFARLTPMVVHAGERILRQGEIGDCCYFIKEGEAVVGVYNDVTAAVDNVAKIGPGRCFGEDALVYEKPRNANITMTTDGVLMRLEQADFDLLLQEASVDEVAANELGALPEFPILIDVRTDEEYAAGHLACSGNIPLSLLSMKKRLLSPGSRYVFYCNSGRRSRAAAYLLGKEGYNVMSLAGGIDGANLSEQLVADENYVLRDGRLVSGQ